MVEKVGQKMLWLLLLVATFISVGFLYNKYIIQHDYRILYLTEEETAQFLIENSEEESAEEAPAEEGVEDITPEEETPEEPLPAEEIDVGEPVPSVE